jgi:hypothetical protein
MQDFTYLSHTVIPKLAVDGNHAHIHMLHDYIENPVHFTMDRNTQNDLILRGKDIDFEWLLPYQQMSIQLNRKVLIDLNSRFFQSKMRNRLKNQTCDNIVTITKVIFGIVENVSVPTLSKFKKLQYADVANKLTWLKQNGTSWNDVYSVLSHFSHSISEVLNTIQDRNNLPDHIMFSEDQQIFKSLLNDFSGMILNAIGAELSDDEIETIKAFVFYVEYEDEIEPRGHFFDWINTGTLFPINHEMNYAYFQDGFTNVMYECVLDLLKGFSSAWKNQQILEKVSQPTFKKRKGKGKRGKAKPFRYKQLHYDVNAGNLVKTKIISEPTSSTSSGVKMTPHQRGATFAYMWVTDQNLGEEEEIFDIKENHKGTDLYKVLRPRKGCSVNGGNAKPIVGKIQSM